MDDLTRIVDVWLDRLARRLADRGFTIEVSDEARTWLARAVLDGTVTPDEPVSIDASDDGSILTVV